LAALLHLVGDLVLARLDALAVQGKHFLGAHVQGLAGIAPVHVIP